MKVCISYSRTAATLPNNNARTVKLRRLRANTQLNFGELRARHSKETVVGWELSKLGLSAKKKIFIRLYDIQINESENMGMLKGRRSSWSPPSSQHRRDLNGTVYPGSARGAVDRGRTPFAGMCSKPR